MKKELLTFLILFLTYCSFAQNQKLKFTYDTAGNQILRDRVCATCLKAVLPQAIDSLVVGSLSDPQTDKNNFAITAYPNPVTQSLFVDWFPHEVLVPTGLEVFSMEGRLMATKPIAGERGEQSLDFGPYPPGVYLVNVSFANGERRTFKVVRN